MKIYAVVDTNVIVSALITKNSESPTRKIFRAILGGGIIPLYNEEILGEYEEVLGREKFHLGEDCMKISNIDGLLFPNDTHMANLYLPNQTLLQSSNIIQGITSSYSPIIQISNPVLSALSMGVFSVYKSVPSYVAEPKAWQITQNMPLFIETPAKYEQIHFIVHNPAAIQLAHLGQSAIEEMNKKRERYLQIIYDALWFPYICYNAGRELYYEIKTIIATSRGASERRQLRIDQAILNHYTDMEIDRIKYKWNKSDLKNYIKRMLREAVNAHINKDYALAINLFLPMLEGILREKIPTRIKNGKITDGIMFLTTENGYDEIYGKFFIEYVYGHCKSRNDVKDGIPNRHAIAHGLYKKYPLRKESLNAILLIDYIIGLVPYD